MQLWLLLVYIHFQLCPEMFAHKFFQRLYPVIRHAVSLNAQGVLHTHRAEVVGGAPFGGQVRNGWMWICMCMALMLMLEV